MTLRSPAKKLWRVRLLCRCGKGEVCDAVGLSRCVAVPYAKRSVAAAMTAGSAAASWTGRTEDRQENAVFRRPKASPDGELEPIDRCENCDGDGDGDDDRFAGSSQSRIERIHECVS